MFRKTNIYYHLIRTRTWGCQEVRNVKFLENFAYVLNPWLPIIFISLGTNVFSEMFLPCSNLSLNLNSGTLCCRIGLMTEEKQGANFVLDLNSFQSEFDIFSQKCFFWLSISTFYYSLYLVVSIYITSSYS